MSWDIFISKIPVDQLEDAEIPTIGTREEVVELLRRIMPDLTFREDGYGYSRDEECSINFDLADRTAINHILFNIRGSGLKPIKVAEAVCKAIDGYAMDCSNGAQIDFDRPEHTSFVEWQAYRRKIIEEGAKE